MKSIVLLLALAGATAQASAPPSRLWGTLEPGPHAVGYRLLERYDASRVYRLPRDLEGRPRAGERARPIAVSVWYPAAPGAGVPMTFGDYAALAAHEDRFGKLSAAEERERGEALYRFGVMARLTPEQRAGLLPLPSMAVRDAAPLAGPFPVILYSLGSAALAHATPEYLASHGYVVVQAPRVGATAGLPPDNFDTLDLVTKLRDMDVMLNALRELPSADLHRLGVVGFSAGGRWGLQKAMEDPDVLAVVSLDTVMLFNDAVGALWRKLPGFDLDAVRVPVLHVIRRPWVAQEDASMWEGMRYADRTTLVFEDARLDHFDFQSTGLASTLTGGRAELAPVVAKTFELWNRATLAFFDAHVKGDPKARAFLARAPEENGAPAGLVTVSRLAAQAPTPTLAEVLNAIDEGNVEAVVRLYAKPGDKPRLPEAVMNLTGYNVLGTGRTADAIRLFELNAAAYPASANACDSLGDAYLAAGDRARALEMSRRAAQLLKADTATDPERKRRIQESIDQKLKVLEGKS